MDPRKVAPMSDNDKPELWGAEQCSMLQRDPDEAIEAELDGWEPPLPPFLIVHGWAPTRLGMKHGDILDRITEDLAGDHQHEDSDPIEPSRRMIDAEKELVDALLADYRPTARRSSTATLRLGEMRVSEDQGAADLDHCSEAAQ